VSAFVTDEWGACDSDSFGGKVESLRLDADLRDNTVVRAIVDGSPMTSVSAPSW